MDVEEIIDYSEKLSENYISISSGPTIELTQLGISKNTIDHFEDKIRIYTKRSIPAFIYTDFQSYLTAYSIFSETYKSHFFLKDDIESAYFFLSPDIGFYNITKVILAPDPIELLSYWQLRPDSKQTTLYIAPHPRVNLNNISVFKSIFPQAVFHSLYPKDNPFDILANLTINLAIKNKPYEIFHKGDTITVQHSGKTFTKKTHDIDNRFLNNVIGHDKKTFKSLYIPKNKASINSLLNDH